MTPSEDHPTVEMSIDTSQFDFALNGDRYFGLDPDGKWRNRLAYAQRPAAIRNLSRTGLAVYDKKEDEIIVKSDPELWNQKITADIESKKEAIRKIEQRRDEVLEALEGE